MNVIRLRTWVTAAVCAAAIAVTAAQSGLDRRISLDFNDAAPEVVFRAVTDAIRCTLDIDPAVRQKVTIRLDRVTVKLALDAACESIGCRWTFDGRQLTVLPLAPRPPAVGGVAGDSGVLRAALARPLPAGLRFERQPVGAALERVARAAGPGFDFRIEGAQARIPVTADVSGRPPVEAAQALVAAAGLKADFPIKSRVAGDRVIRTFSVKLVLLGPGEPPTLPEVLARAAEAAAAFATPDRRIMCEERGEQTLLVKIWGVEERVYDEFVAMRDVVLSLDLSTTPARRSSSAPWEEVLRVVSVSPLRAAGPTKEGRMLDEFGKPPNFPALWSGAHLPRMAAVLLHGINQPRFQFTKAGEASVSGVRAWEIRFRETGSPPLFTAPVEGSLWVDPSGGHVVKSVIRTTGRGPLDEMTVTFASNRVTSLWLPATMKQRTELLARSRMGRNLIVETAATFTACHPVAPGSRKP